MQNDEVNLQSLLVKPIGYISSRMSFKFAAPHQPDLTKKEHSEIVLLPNKDFHKAVEDLSGFEYIWLIWWFHKNETWKPKVRPPRGEQKKRGVFATRSPHRPNPIGISCVPLIEIQDRRIIIGASDLVDGTPILDIKPYIPSVDSFPNAQIGWLKEVEEESKSAPKYEIIFEEKADKQIAWLKDKGENFIERAIDILKRDPSVNRTRRISKHDEKLFRMGCGGWRIFFTVEDKKIRIDSVQTSNPLAPVKESDINSIRARDLSLEFNKVFPCHFTQIM